MKIQESGQDYLETILILTSEKQNVRSIDIAKHMNLTRQSIHRAIKNFHENNLIEISPKGFISLTDEGKKIAIAIYEKHKTISEFLMKLGVSEKTALEDACKIEHDISEETLNAIKAYNK